MAQWIFQVVLSGSYRESSRCGLCFVCGRGVQDVTIHSIGGRLGQSRLRGLLISHPVFYVVAEQCGGMGG